MDNGAQPPHDGETLRPAKAVVIVHGAHYDVEGRLVGMVPIGEIELYAGAFASFRLEQVVEKMWAEQNAEAEYFRVRAENA